MQGLRLEAEPGLAARRGREVARVAAQDFSNSLRGEELPRARFRLEAPRRRRPFLRPAAVPALAYISTRPPFFFGEAGAFFAVKRWPSTSFSRSSELMIPTTCFSWVTTTWWILFFRMIRAAALTSL